MARLPPGDEIEQILRAMVCPLVVEDARGATVVGSSFVVACSGRDALMVTAKHNFGWAMPRDQSHPSTPSEFRPLPPESWMVSNETPYVFAFCDGRLVPARVHDVILHADYDLAVFHSTLSASDATFKYQIGFDSSAPSLHDEVTCIGFPNMTVSTSSTDATGEIPSAVDLYSFPLVARDGEIVEIVDRAEAKGAPIFRVDVAIDSGMSGGPVVRLRNGRPYVCAVAMSDWTFDGDPMRKGSGRAKATAVFPVLDLGAPRAWGPTGTASSMRDLRASGILVDAAYP